MRSLPSASSRFWKEESDHGGNPRQPEQAIACNLVSGKAYRGVNVFLLHAVSYASPFWLTFKQAQTLGGSVRKGEKACPVVFWKWLDTDELDGQGKAKRLPMLR